MRQGKPVLCGNLAEIYVALCESMGLVARTVGLSLMVRDGTFGSDTHAGAEVWVPEIGGWVYQDSTFNCYWEIDGKPASALQLHDALMEARVIKLVSPNPKAEALVRSYYVDPRFFFRHISYEYKAGGPYSTLLTDGSSRLTCAITTGFRQAIARCLKPSIRRATRSSNGVQRWRPASSYR